MLAAKTYDKKLTTCKQFQSMFFFCFYFYFIFVDARTSAPWDTDLTRVKRDLSLLLQGMNYNEMTYKEILRRITYVS